MLQGEKCSDGLLGDLWLSQFSVRQTAGIRLMSRAVFAELLACVSITGKDAEKPSGPELRKRRASTGQMPPSKRSRANSSTGIGLMAFF